ncbi:MAG: VWA domain-containing protein [Chloroflexota bacterium]
MTDAEPGFMTASRGRSRCFLLVAVLLVLAPVLAVSRPAAAADTLLVINQVTTDQFPQVAVYLTFTDGAGLPITDVSKDRVQVVHNGQPIPDISLELAASDQDGLSLVVAVDTSGSMKGEPLEYARSAVRSFLDLMGPRDRGAIVSFGQTSQVVQDLTGDRDALSRAIDSLAANGDTTLYDGAFEAISLVAKQPLGRRAVIIISDGEDTHSTFTLDDVIAKARETSTPVSAIAIGDFQREPLRRLTQTTGGALSEAPSADSLAERAQQMADRLRAQYVVRYRAPDSRPPENEVEVTISQGGQQARAAQRFPAPPMPLAISLPALQPDSTVSGQVELQPSIANAERVDQVEYLLDGTSIGTVTEPPYRFTWNTAATPPGQHTLTIRARLGEQQVEQTVPLVVAEQQAPPSPSGGSPIAQGSPSPGASPGGSPGAVVTPQTGGTATPVPPRTPTGTPTSNDNESGLLGRISPLVWIGLAIVAATVGGILIVVNRRSGAASSGSSAGPNTLTSLPPAAGAGSRPGPLPGASPGPHPGHLPGPHPGQPPDPAPPYVAERPTMHDVREAQTQMASALPRQQPTASAPPASASLTVLVPGRPERGAPLGPDQIIGRSTAPGVIVVDDPQVSRRHARISWEDGHFVYRDLGPMNPTRQAGRTLPNPYILRSGDRLAVGKSEIIFRM